jgi:hypothetical protein
MPTLGGSQGPDLGESQMPHKGDFAMLSPDHSPPDSSQDMPPDNSQQPPTAKDGDERADDPATHRLQPDHIRLMGKYIFIQH